jgi:Tfp pilus assembly protein PilO
MLLRVWLVVIAGFCLVVFAAKPMLDRSGKLSVEIEQQRGALTIASRAQQRIETLRKEDRQLEAKIAAATRKGSDLAPIVLKELEATASRLNLRLSLVTPLLPTEGDGLRRFPFQFQISAPFPEFTEFLFDLEKPGHSLFLEMLEISPAPREPGTVAATVRVAAFTPLSAEEEKQTQKGRPWGGSYGR